MFCARDLCVCVLICNSFPCQFRVRIFSLLFSKGRNKVVFFMCPFHSSFSGTLWASSEEERELPYSLLFEMFCFATTVFLWFRAGKYLGVEGSVDKQDWCLNLFHSSFIQRDVTSYFLAVLFETVRATGKLLVLSVLPNTIAKYCQCRSCIALQTVMFLWEYQLLILCLWWGAGLTCFHRLTRHYHAA